MRILFRAATIALPVFCMAALACTSSNPASDAGPNTQQVCPSNIVQATAAPKDEGTSSACHVENYTCVVAFACGSFAQQATCVCETQNGTQAFSCTLNSDPSHAVLDQPVTDPMCEAAPGIGVDCSLCKSTEGDGGTDVCPTDKTTADGTPCHNAGQICTYTTTCGGSPPPVDQCQCDPNASGDAGLSWSCDLNNCP